MDMSEEIVCTLYHRSIWTCVGLKIVLYRTLEYEHVYDENFTAYHLSRHM